MRALMVAGLVLVGFAGCASSGSEEAGLALGEVQDDEKATASSEANRRPALARSRLEALQSSLDQGLAERPPCPFAHSL